MKTQHQNDASATIGTSRLDPRTIFLAGSVLLDDDPWIMLEEDTMIGTW